MKTWTCQLILKSYQTTKKMWTTISRNKDFTQTHRNLKPSSLCQPAMYYLYQLSEYLLFFRIWTGLWPCQDKLSLNQPKSLELLPIVFELSSKFPVFKTSLIFNKCSQDFCQINDTILLPWPSIDCSVQSSSSILSDTSIYQNLQTLSFPINKSPSVRTLSGLFLVDYLTNWHLTNNTFFLLLPVVLFF